MRPLAMLLSFAVGLLSLSQEIVWVRLVGFGQQGRPQAFALVLVAFLLGIAAGAGAGRRLCAAAGADAPRLLRNAGFVLVGAALLDIAALQLAAAGLAVTSYSPPSLAALLLLCGACAAAKGTLFPIVHHLGSVATVRRIGRSVSRVYLANVIGATLGPVITGFWLLDVIGMEAVFALIALATAALGALALAAASRRGATTTRPAAAAGAATAVLAAAVATLAAPPGVVERIATDGRAFDADGRPALRHLIQNRHGVLHVMAEDSPGSGDITFGGNAYDGRVSLDMRINANGLDRAYAMAVLHPAPKRVLVVGMSTGAWTAVIVGLPGVEHIDVVEINPGYLELMARYPDVAPLLRDPRVTIHVDDARRWLRAHPDRRYDLVFQNTTWHWRAHVSLLLSREYLQQLRGHLEPGGIVAINTTSSADVFHTATQVYAHVGRRRNFAYLSDSPLAPQAGSESVLRSARLRQRPAFDDAAFAPGGLAASLLRLPVEPAAVVLRQASALRSPRVISDLSPVNEYRHGAAPPWDALSALLPADAGPWPP